MAAAQFPGIDPGKGPDQLSSRYDWLGTARGRVGVTGGNALFYATGGLAYGRVSHQYNYDITNGFDGNQIFRSSENRGWMDRRRRRRNMRSAATGRSRLNICTSTLPARILNLAACYTVATAAIAVGGYHVPEFNNNLNIVRLGANYRF